MVHHFVEGPAAVNLEDQIAFIKGMCDTGESVRFGYRPQEGAAQEFADLVAGHARRQFEDGRRTLAEAKASLRGFARRTLVEQVNEVIDEGQLETVESRFSGIWEWCIRLDRPEPHRKLFLVFGPTAAQVMSQVSATDFVHDYSRIFVTYEAAEVLHTGHFVQTAVGIDEVINGLPHDDLRLRDAVLRLLCE